MKYTISNVGLFHPVLLAFREGYGLYAVKADNQPWIRVRRPYLENDGLTPAQANRIYWKRYADRPVWEVPTVILNGHYTYRDLQV